MSVITFEKANFKKTKFKTLKDFLNYVLVNKLLVDKNKIEIGILSESEKTKEIKRLIKETKKMSKSNFINICCFFQKLLKGKMYLIF